MIVYPNISLTGISQSAAIVPYQTVGTQIGQLPAQPISKVGLLATVSNTGNLTYSVQVSCDNPQILTNWVNHDVLNNLTQTEYSFIQWPVTAIRLVCTAWVSGTVNLGVVQWP